MPAETPIALDQIETFTAELDLPPEQQNTWKLSGAKIDDAAQWLPNRSFDALLHRLARPKIFCPDLIKLRTAVQECRPIVWDNID